MQPNLCRFAPILATVALFLSTRQPLLADSFDDQADVVVRDALKAWQVPGAAVAVVRGDEVVYLKGHGVRELGKDEPVTPDTLFAIGSCTKAFTATALALLVDEGKLSWDDPVRKHVPFFRLADALADENVTLRDLLCHRSGMGRHDLLWLRTPWSLEESVRRAGRLPLSHSFRSTYEYNNIAYLTAGFAVASASGSTWQDFVQRRLFDPLAMKGAVFTSSAAQHAADHASPHLRNPADEVRVIPWYDDDRQIRASGSIKAGVRDLSKWLRLQLGEGSVNGQQLVSVASLKETHRPQMVQRLPPEVAREMGSTQLSYGLGWNVQDYRGHLIVYHGGSVEGFRAHIVLVPKEKLGVVVLSNRGDPNELPQAVGQSLVDLSLGLPRKDWNAFYLERARKAEVQRLEREQERDAKRHKGTKPSRELSAYAAIYEDPGYGKVTITRDGDKLRLQWSSFDAECIHWHYDTFQLQAAWPAQRFIDKEFVLFTLGSDGAPGVMQFLGREFKRSKEKP